MSSLAKVFVVILLLLAVAFTGTTATLFTGRKNWKEESEKREDSYKKDAQAWLESKTGLDGEIAKNKTTISEKDIQLATLTESNRSLLGKVEEVNVQISGLTKDIKTKEDRVQQLVGYVADKDKEISRLSQESDAAKVARETAEKSQQAALLANSRTTLDNNNLNQKIEELSKELNETKKSYDDVASVVARLKDLYPKIHSAITISRPAPAIDGVVVAVDPEAKMVVLSVGAEDKVESGFNFTVSRGDKLIGKVETTKVTSDLAGAKVIYTTGDIQVGDQVTTRLSN